ncbi:hypothetical protein GCM10019016_081390 [Streptomyces prasinosporus]|uniref:Uncharacterized protein n=1 Tax=Streptomyces prasinosporus TaxID=68256 RepID=A0ABP6U0V9_9ACTN|nr:hypothetical protein GCM10010332_51610 [Streptomyces albogriseolus]
MHGADEKLGQSTDISQFLSDARDDALLQLSGRPVGEREGDNVPRFHAGQSEQLHYPPGDDFGLSGSSARDDSQVPVHGVDRCQLI